MESFDGYYSVECQLCHRHFQAITWAHLKWEHGISTYAYRETYPDEPMVCGQLVEEKAEDMRGFTHSPETCIEIGRKISAVREKKYWSNWPGHEPYLYAKEGDGIDV